MVILTLMITLTRYNPTRLHFLLKLLGGMLLYWAFVWGLHFLVYGDNLLPANYVWLSVLLPAAAALELAARDKSRRSLAGLSRSQIWSVSQREILFVIVTLLGVLVMSKEDRLSRAFLGMFLCLYSVWIMWMNQVAHRILQRRSSRQTRRRNLAAPALVAGEDN